MPGNYLAFTRTCLSTTFVGNRWNHEIVLTPKHLRNNPYGVKALPGDVYTEAVDAFFRPGGCSDQVLACANQTVEERESDPSTCVDATTFCRNNVEGPYYQYSGRGAYGKQAPRTTSCCDHPLEVYIRLCMLTTSPLSGIRYKAPQGRPNSSGLFR